MPSLFCDNCGVALKAGSRFCKNCGTRVEEDAPAPVDVLSGGTRMGRTQLPAAPAADTDVLSGGTRMGRTQLPSKPAPVAQAPQAISRLVAPVPSSSGTIDEGALLADRFQVITRLGKSGMGEVFLAFDRETKQQVALKTVVPDPEEHPALLDALKKEVAAIRGLPSHPNLLRVLDLEFRHAPPFYTMEYASRGDLAELWLKRGRKLPADEVTQLLSQLLSALSVLHEAGVVHQDIKPQNVLLMANGTPKLTDFGISKSLREQLDGGQGDGAGTLLYMAPEHLRGEVCDPTVDLYACGIMAVQLLTGAYPFKGTTEAEVKRWHQGGRRDFAHLPAPYNELIPRMLAVLPEDRVPTAHEAMELLTPDTNDLPTSPGSRPSAPVAVRRAAPLVPEALSSEAGFRPDLDLRETVFLSPDEARQGGINHVTVGRVLVCPECAGRGTPPVVGESVPRRCPDCHGRGTVETGALFWKGAATCPKCNGQGRYVPSLGPCGPCGGNGERWIQKQVEFELAAPVRYGATLRLKRCGLPRRGESELGDVYFTLQRSLAPVVPLNKLTQAYLDLYAANTRDFWTATYERRTSGILRQLPGGSLEEFTGFFRRATDFGAVLPALNDCVMIKGEALLGYAGPHFVTNYRLQLLVDQRRIIIPLAFLERYDLKAGPLSLEWREYGKRKDLSVTGSILIPEAVSNAQAGKDYTSLDPNQVTLLWAHRNTVQSASPGLSIPRIGLL